MQILHPEFKYEDLEKLFGKLLPPYLAGNNLIKNDDASKNAGEKGGDVVLTLTLRID